MKNVSFKIKHVVMILVTILFLSCSFDDGEDGAPGLDGMDGIDGVDGMDGADGLNGGADGADGAPGPEGPQGEPGADGTDGTDGQDGADGNANVSNFTINTANIVRNTSGLSVEDNPGSIWLLPFDNLPQDVFGTNMRQDIFANDAIFMYLFNSSSNLIPFYREIFKYRGPKFLRYDGVGSFVQISKDFSLILLIPMVTA